MACKHFALALSLVAAGSPLAASQPEPMRQSMAQALAPQAPADARYCLRVDPPTGSRIETIRCETRWDWEMLDVDVDQEWAENGVRVIGPAPRA
jgi:hypothetical protein